MIVRLYKEKDVEIDIDSIKINLNKKLPRSTSKENLEFEKGEDFESDEIYLNKNINLDKLDNNSSEIKIYISNKPYDDNYFFHEKNNTYLISFSNWELLTTFSKNSGLVYFIADILSLIIDDSFRHHDDSVKSCLYNFRWNKTEIHEGIESSSICELCQDRIIKNESEYSFLLDYVILILEELRFSTRHYDDIVEYWKNNKKEKVKLFFSYSHKDKELLNEFKEHIQVLEQNGLIDKWDDNELIIGEDWDSSIKEKMYSSDIIIFLLSPSSLSSQYIYEKELKIAFELKEMNKSYVAPILIRDCLWDMTAFKDFHILPLDNKSVNSEVNRDKAWVNVTKGLTKAIYSILENKNNLPNIENKIGNDEELILYFLKYIQHGGLILIEL